MDRSRGRQRATPRAPVAERAEPRRASFAYAVRERRLPAVSLRATPTSARRIAWDLEERRSRLRTRHRPRSALRARRCPCQLASICLRDEQISPDSRRSPFDGVACPRRAPSRALLRRRRSPEDSVGDFVSCTRPTTRPPDRFRFFYAAPFIGSPRARRTRPHRRSRKARRPRLRPPRPAAPRRPPSA